MDKEIKIKPNAPTKIRLKDPRGDYWNDETRESRYETTDGDFIRLHRQGVEALFMADPDPGEEIVICQVANREITIALSNPSELARAAQESSQEPRTESDPPKPPTPIRKPVLEIPRPQTRADAPPDPRQPRLFDKGTGTYGPAPRPAIRPAPKSQRPTVDPIPANVAVREILAFINIDPGTKNWSAEAKQDLASTVYIAHARKGHIGLWERGE